MKITLANLADASEQQVFDHVSEHLMKQGRRSIAEEGSLADCQYHGTEGRMCAAGCLMADDEYNSDWEGRSWGALVDWKFVPNAHTALIIKLQDAHDQNMSDVGRTWREYILGPLMYIANEHKLSLDALHAAFDTYKDAPTT